MNTQQAFEKMATRYNMIDMLNQLAEIDDQLVNLVRDTFNYAVLMAKTKRYQKLADMCYECIRDGKEMNVTEILNIEIEENEIEEIHEKFIENLKVFYSKFA